jgi:hypothetical protein
MRCKTAIPLSSNAYGVAGEREGGEAGWSAEEGGRFGRRLHVRPSEIRGRGAEERGGELQQPTWEGGRSSATARQEIARGERSRAALSSLPYRAATLEEDWASSCPELLHRVRSDGPEARAGDSHLAF